jgi:hypothetical protein
MNDTKNAARCALKDISRNAVEKNGDNFKKWDDEIVSSSNMGVLDRVFRDTNFKFKRIKPFVGNLDDLLDLDI